VNDGMLDVMAKAIFIAEHEGSDPRVLEMAWTQSEHHDFRPKRRAMAAAALDAMNQFLAQQTKN
jgi:hypothetical protein